MSSYHDSHPIHYAASNGDDTLAFKREGNTIIVYPGAFRLTLSGWASAVAFTSLEGETGPLHRALLGLLGGSPETSRVRDDSSGGGETE